MDVLAVLVVAAFFVAAFFAAAVVVAAVVVAAVVVAAFFVAAFFVAAVVVAAFFVAAFFVAAFFVAAFFVAAFFVAAVVVAAVVVESLVAAFVDDGEARLGCPGVDVTDSAASVDEGTTTSTGGFCLRGAMARQLVRPLSTEKGRGRPSERDIARARFVPVRTVRTLRRRARCIGAAVDAAGLVEDASGRPAAGRVAAKVTSASARG